MDLKETILSNTSKKTSGRLLRFFLLTSFVPIIVIFIGGYYTTKTMLRDEALAKQSALVDREHEKVAILIEKLKVDTASWASDNRIRELTQKIYDGGCAEWKALANCPLSQELSVYITKNKLSLDPTIGMVDVLDKQGTVVASNKPEHLGTNEGVQDTRFQEAITLRFGQATFFPELVSEEEAFSGRPMINLTAPIASLDGKRLVGVFLAHTESVGLNQVITVEEDITTEVYLVNNKKKMVTPSRKNATTVLTQTVDTSPVRACIDHNENFKGSYANYNGIQVIGASICDPAHFGTLIMETEESEVFANINKFRNNTLVILAIILALIIGYVFFSEINILKSAVGMLPKTFSSIMVTGISIAVVIIAAESVSFLSARSMKNYILEQKTSIIFDLVKSEAERHFSSPIFVSWQSKESQSAFRDSSEHLSDAYRSISAINIYTPDGATVWSSLANAKLGATEEESAVKVAQTIKEGRVIENADTETVAELGAKDILEIYTPIKSDTGAVIAVAEIYFDTSDITSFIQKFQLFLWVITLIAMTGIFILLRFAFRRQDENIIMQAEELKGIIDGSPIGIYTINTNGIILTYNPAMMKISGITDQKETIGKNVFDAEAYRKIGLDKLLHEAIDGSVFETEVEVESSLGEHKKTFRHYYGVPVRNEGGLVEYVLVMVEDITERKALQAKIDEYAKDLEGKINERTKDLESKIVELERFQKLTVDREIRMTELKQQIEKMRVKLESLGVSLSEINS